MPSAVQAQRVIYPAGTLVGNASFIGPLDALVAQGASIIAAYSVRRLLTSYAGVACRLRGNGTGSPEANIPFTNAGDLDLAAVSNLIANGGGSAAFWVSALNQSGVVNATQSSASIQPAFSTAYQSKGAIGGAAVTDALLTIPLGTLTNPFFIQCVVSHEVATKHILGSDNTTNTPLIRTSTGMVRANFGVSLSGVGTLAMPGKHAIGVLSNGASSAIYVNGSLDVSGSTGGTSLNFANARLGRSVTGGAGNSWFGHTGNTLSEFIIFSGNPTGLAGWANFIAAQKTYFGTT